MVVPIILVILFRLSLVSAISPSSNNTVFTNPSNTTSSPIIWELGTTQVIQWNTTASPLSLDLYQFIAETQNYESAYLFQDFDNITEFAFMVDIIEPLNSTGEGSFHLKLVPPNYNGLPNEGVDSAPFIIRDPKFQNSSSSSSSSRIPSTTATAVSYTLHATSTVTAAAKGSASTSLPDANRTTASAGLSPSAKEGLGVGLGLGLAVLILANAATIVWWVRRHGRKPPVPRGDTEHNSTHGTRFYTQHRFASSPFIRELSPWSRRRALFEVTETSTPRREMADTSRGELQGFERRVELGEKM